MEARAVLVLWCASAAFASHAQAQRVACAGASITAGWGLSDPQRDGYPAQLEGILHRHGRQWEVRDFGVAGAVVLRNAPMTAYIETSACNLALAWEPDAVVIQLGGNDSLPGNWAHQQDFVADFLALIDAFAELPSRPLIYIWIPTPIFSSPYGHDNRVIRDEIVPRIRQLQTVRDVHLIDLYTPFEDKTHLFPDGIHPNAEGAGLIAEIIAAAIIGTRTPPDFNGDWKVDIEDLIILIEHWGRNEPSLDIAPPPLGDGIVDRQDLEALMECWGQEIPNPALIAHWKLDESEGIVAGDSAGTSDGVLVGNPLWQPTGGKFDGALLLDGVNDSVSAPFVLDPAARPFSAFAWVKGGAPGQVVISQVDGVNWLMAGPSQGTLMTELVPPAGRKAVPPLVSDSVITDGDWHRVGFAWDGSSRRLYVDDVLVAEDTQSGLAGCSGGLYIGAGKGLEPGSFWSGLIDDIRIYNRAVRP